MEYYFEYYYGYHGREFWMPTKVSAETKAEVKQLSRTLKKCLNEEGCTNVRSGNGVRLLPYNYDATVAEVKRRLLINPAAVHLYEWNFESVIITQTQPLSAATAGLTDKFIGANPEDYGNNICKVFPVSANQPDADDLYDATMAIHLAISNTGDANGNIDPVWKPE